MKEPALADELRLWRAISLVHGPRRYEDPAKAVTGAMTLVEPAPDYLQDPTLDPEGKGAVWGWFVGSPRVFQFGLARTKKTARAKLLKIFTAEQNLASALEQDN